MHAEPAGNAHPASSGVGSSREMISQAFVWGDRCVGPWETGAKQVTMGNRLARMPMSHEYSACIAPACQVAGDTYQALRVPSCRKSSLTNGTGGI